MKILMLCVYPSLTFVIVIEIKMIRAAIKARQAMYMGE